MKAPFLCLGLADVLWLSLAGLCLPAIQAAGSFRVQIAWTESGQARLTWSAPGPGYEYTVETTRSLAPPDWQILAPAEQWPTPDTQCLIELNPHGSTAFYRVRATGIFDPDNPPEDLAAALTDHGVVLDWSLVAGASGYALYWATSGEGWPESAVRVGEVHPPYLLRDLPPGQTLHVAVAALAGTEEGMRGIPIVVQGPGEPIDPSVASTLFSASRFLYQGGLATQEGVAENAIEPARTAVLSGRVLTSDGAPLSGVRIAILDHELLRFGARDYQPSTGRWTASDPRLLEGGRRLRVYAGNDPINRWDPTGTLERSTCNEPRAIPLTSRDLINRGADEAALGRAGMMSEPQLENLEQQLRLAKRERMKAFMRNAPKAPPGFSSLPVDNGEIIGVR